MKFMIDDKDQDISTDSSENIYFAVPGPKKYFNRYYKNRAASFVNLSVTGSRCALQCAHCSGRLLQTMVSVPAPEDMYTLIDSLAAKNCNGILVSGGCNISGEVPLLPYIKAIEYAKKRGLKTIVHAGIINEYTAYKLAEAGIHQVLLDIIGNAETIREVYHLDRKPEDYYRSMQICKEAGLKIAPHVVIGLHFGQIRGEIYALDMISKIKPEVLVLVILTPMADTVMEKIEPPAMEQLDLIMRKAQEQSKETTVTLGCARPAGVYKRQAERMAVDRGVNVIAYPDVSTIVYAQNRGRKAIFVEECCCLIGAGVNRAEKDGSNNNHIRF